MRSLAGRRRNGQTMVQVAVLMLVFLALLIIAIDMGHILNERRRMQNAADAGALAGAWEVCFGDPDRAVLTAREYAIDRNGAQAADVSIAQRRVTVSAREAAKLHLAGIFGVNTSDINARAVAACGAATSGCGLWPIAFPIQRWKQFYDTGCRAESEKEGVRFYVWAGYQESNSPDCEFTHECDMDGDKVDDVVDFRGRAFLDFGDDKIPPYLGDCRKPGCGDAELKCWISNESGGIVDLPACIPGTTGVKAGVHNEVNDRIGDIVGIPLYTGMHCPGPGYCPGGERYLVRTIGCVKVLGWVQELTLPRLDGGSPPWKGKAIEVQMVCRRCRTSCGRTTGLMAEPWEMSAVSLIE
jgi:hypothetical protein